MLRIQSKQQGTWVDIRGVGKQQCVDDVVRPEEDMVPDVCFHTCNLCVPHRAVDYLSVPYALHVISCDVHVPRSVAAAIGGPLPVRSTLSHATTSHMTPAHMSPTGVSANSLQCIHPLTICMH